MKTVVANVMKGDDGLISLPPDTVNIHKLQKDRHNVAVRGHNEW